TVAAIGLLLGAIRMAGRGGGGSRRFASGASPGAGEPGGRVGGGLSRRQYARSAATTAERGASSGDRAVVGDVAGAPVAQWHSRSGIAGRAGASACVVAVASAARKRASPAGGGQGGRPGSGDSQPVAGGGRPDGRLAN